MRRRLFALVLAGTLAGAAAAAQEAAPPVTVAATLDTTATVVGGRLRLRLDIETEAGWLVAPPAETVDLSPFRVRAIERVAGEGHPGYVLYLVPLAPGDLQVPPVALTVAGPEGASATIETSPVPVRVESNLPPGEEAPEPEDPERAGPPIPGTEPEAAAMKPKLEAPRDWVPLIIAVALFLLAAIGGFFLLRKLRELRRPPEEKAAPVAKQPLRPAWETALEELDRIAAADFVEKGEVDRQYVEVTETLRRYLEERYGIPALESTTEDLIELLRPAPLPSDVASRVLSLLREADLVKFAKARPDLADARSSEGRARELVLGTMPRPQEEAA